MDEQKFDNDAGVASITDDFSKLNLDKGNLLLFMRVDNTIINLIEPVQTKYLKNKNFSMNRVN